MPRVNFQVEQRAPLPGSERAAFAGSRDMAAGASRAASRERITVTIVMPPKTTPAPVSQGELLTRPAYKAKYGPAAASVRMVKLFAGQFGLTVAAGAGPRMLQLSGTRRAIEAAFAVKLEDADGFRVRTGTIDLPESLLPHVEAVLGLDNRPQAQAHFRVRPAAQAGVSFTPPQVAALYGFPAGASAAGQTIALIELGGGFRQADLTAYFKTLGLPLPVVKAVSVDKDKNTPGTADGADGEVMLDIEVCGSVAPGAKIAVYFAPNTDQGFLDAITTAIHDTTNKPSVISISWGGPESSWTAQALTAMDAACAAAAALGVTITVACGDNGSTDGVAGTANHVDFPASSPHVLACGGTKLNGSGSTIASEVVWNELAANEGATGGGVSAVFAKPPFQSTVNVPKPTVKTGGRGVPDVSGNADPATGYVIRVDGQTSVIGGTSAVAPLWAGLISLSNTLNKRAAGFVNTALYAQSKGALRDITSGNNGAFKAGTGWDACTGLGSPIGTGVVAVLGKKTT